MSELRQFGPKAPDHPGVGVECLACGVPFVVGDYTALVPVGPGDDPDQQAKARDGRPYTAIGVEVHWLCATGEPAPSPESAGADSSG
jgi:hypothetical protein